MAIHSGRTNSCTIAPMRERDIPFAISLTDREGWGFFRRDFQAKLKLYPSGSFVARTGGERVGIISSVKYDSYAFLGNLIVRDGFRGHGIGGLLMRRAIDDLLAKGVRTIELDGVLAAVSLYRRLGFKDKHLSLRLARPPQEGAVDRADSQTPAAKILALDWRLTGVARQRLLKAALSDKSNSLVGHGKPVSAYALIRERAGGFYMVAPLVATSWRQIPPLLDVVVRQYSDRPLWIGVPEPQYRMSQLLTANGFEYKEPSLRMYLGQRLDYERHVYGIFGPAIG